MESLGHITFYSLTLLLLQLLLISKSYTGFLQFNISQFCKYIQIWWSQCCLYLKNTLLHCCILNIISINLVWLPLGSHCQRFWWVRCSQSEPIHVWGSNVALRTLPGVKLDKDKAEITFCSSHPLYQQLMDHSLPVQNILSTALVSSVWKRPKEYTGKRDIIAGTWKQVITLKIRLKYFTLY